MSYENLIMYNAVTPSYKKPDDKKPKDKKSNDKSTGKGMGFGDFMSQMKQLQGK